MILRSRMFSHPEQIAFTFRASGPHAAFQPNQRRCLEFIASRFVLPSVTLAAEEQTKTPKTIVLFEDLTEEYDENESETLLLPSDPTSPSDHIKAKHRWTGTHHFMPAQTGLSELVKAGDYARAENLRNELFETDSHIKRDLIYAEAALHAWKTNSIEDRTDAFYNWFRLIPGAVLGFIRQGRKMMYHVKSTLFTEPTDLNTIACFGIVAARKGFINFVCVDIITHVARFASPGVSSAFFDACEKSATMFYSRFNSKTKADSAFSIWNDKQCHNTYLRALCFAGYVDAAVDRLEHSVKRDVEIEPFTWVIFLEDLASVGRHDLVATVRKLRGKSVDRHLTQDPNFSPVPSSPSATELAQLMNEWIESGDIQSLYQLREDMVQPGRFPDLWATAQMLYYQNKGQHAVVLRQFMEYYMCVGVPKEPILQHLESKSPLYRAEYDKAHTYLPPISAPTGSRGQTRWASTHTITLVWQALAALVEDAQSLGRLYYSFLEYWDRHRPSTSIDTPPVALEELWRSARFQYPPVMSPDTVHFHVFIVAFSRLGGTDAAMQVLVDMHARGIRPDTHNWTVIAGKYATQDDFRSVEKILRRMEATLDAEATPAASAEPNDNVTRTRLGPVSRPRTWIPGPTLVTYTSILRGLIVRGRLAEAKQFRLRMEKAGYKPGSNEHTDMVLELLDKREVMPRISWQERAHWQPGRSKGQ